MPSHAHAFKTTHRAARTIAACAVLIALLIPSLAFAQESDPRTFADTGYTIADDAIWSFFTQYGGASTFGEPISREFSLADAQVQLFQNAALQVQRDGSVQVMQLSDLPPSTSINGLTLPAPDGATSFIAPTPDQPNYAARLSVFQQAAVPGPFQSVYTSTGGVAVWGMPTSAPKTDPNNPKFVYQRFQNGILFFNATSGTTQPLPLGEYLKEPLKHQGISADAFIPEEIS